MRVHLSNAAYGVLDYIAYPVGMLVVAPIAIRGLGVAQYGVWMVASAALTIGSIVASGFGDANIRYVSIARGASDRTGLIQAVRSTMGIHVVLGIAVALLAWILSPLGADHIAASNAPLRHECLWSLRIVSILMFVRAIETVCVSTQRAFEHYGVAVRFSLMGRLLALLAAALLVLAGHGVVSIMLATAIFTIAGLAAQLVELRRLTGASALRPAFHPDATRSLLGFGVFSWIQAVAGVLFGQVDRLITGVYLGAATVASYALCAQMAQPVYGIAAAGLHFLFPYVSARSTGDSLGPLRRVVALTLGANVLLVAVCAAPLLALGNRILTIWAGQTIAQAGRPVLPYLVCGSALQALSVTGAYTLLALGKVRVATLVNLAGGIAMILATPWLLPKYGAHGMAVARLLCGPISLLVYIPLTILLFHAARRPEQRTTIAVCEETGR
jgi:O-antigen/teichoic acid export membrane protein